MKLKVVVVLLTIALAFVTVHADWYHGSHGVINGGATLDHSYPRPYYHRRRYYGRRYYGRRYHGRRYYGRRYHGRRRHWIWGK